MDVWTDFFAGCCGGIAGTIVGHPIDTIKVRQQTNHAVLTFRRCVQLTWKHEGAMGLFKGMSSPLYTAAAVNAIFFGVYGSTVKVVQNYLGESPNTRNTEKQPGYDVVCLGGMVAGAAQLILCCPADLIKIKLQTGPMTTGSPTNSFIQHKPFKGPLDCITTLYKMQGIRGFYKGLVPMFWRDAPSFGMYMVIYELILREGRKRTEWGENVLSLVGGGITGTITWMSVVPFDVVKSRIQADCVENPKYNGMLHCVRVLYTQHGWQVFFRGMQAIASRALIVNAVTFLVYHKTLSWFAKE